MENKKDNQEVTITGYFGKQRKFNYKFFEETSKSAINTKIYFGKDDKLESVNIKAFNATAEKLKATLLDEKKEGIKKIEVTGKFKDIEYENKEGKPVKGKELQITDFVKFKVMEIQGNISKVVEGETPHQHKKYTEILVMDDKVVQGGKAHTETYKVTLWEENKKSIPSDVKLEKGARIAVKGEASILENKTDRDKQYISIDAWNVDQNMKKLHEQIATKQANKQVKVGAGQDQGIGI